MEQLVTLTEQFQKENQGWNPDSKELSSEWVAGKMEALMAGYFSFMFSREEKKNQDSKAGKSKVNVVKGRIFIGRRIFVGIQTV